MSFRENTRRNEREVESFSIGLPPALFRVFSWSHLLEFTKRTTNTSDEYPGVLLHYQIACLNHVIDVICTAPPAISIRSGSLIGRQSLQ